MVHRPYGLNDHLFQCPLSREAPIASRRYLELMLTVFSLCNLCQSLSTKAIKSTCMESNYTVAYGSYRSPLPSQHEGSTLAHRHVRVTGKVLFSLTFCHKVLSPVQHNGIFTPKIVSSKVVDRNESREVAAPTWE